MHAERDTDLPPPGGELSPRVSALLGRRETWAMAPEELEDDVVEALRRERDATAPTPLAPESRERAPAAEDDMPS
jgi:hypothetical protein